MAKIRILLWTLLIMSCHNTSERLQANKNRNDSILKMIINRSNNYQITDNMDSLGFFLDSIKGSVQMYYDDSVKITWLVCKIQQVRRQEKLDSQSYYMHKALELSKSPVISKRQLLNFYIIFGNEIVEKYRDSALKIGNDAYHLAIQLDSFRYAETSFDLAEIYESYEDNVNFRKYLFEAWKYREQEPEMTPYIARRIATYYDKLGQTDSAIHFLTMIENDSSYLWNTELRSQSYQNKAYFLSQEGKTREAMKYLFKAKVLNDSIGKSNVDIFNDLSQGFAELKQFDKAILYIDSSLFHWQQEADFPEISSSWKLKAEIYLQAGRYEAAYKALDSAFAYYTIEMDSSFRIRARETEAKYSVREKDAEIKSLAQSNAASIKIRRQQRVIIFTLISAAILASILGVSLWKRRRARIIFREADLRQQLFRVQMQPHFLFNMLSLLQALIHNNDEEKSTLLLTKFSRLLRAILENFRKKFVALSEEIAVLESYLTIQSMLLEKKFTFRIEIDPAIDKEAVQIPPMLLQPFAENAIQHGFHNLGYNGLLHITIKTANGSLICTIEDNGKGMQQPILKDGRIHAFDITKERLDILAKQTHRPTKFEIIDKVFINAGQGVKVEIKIPLVLN